MIPTPNDIKTQKEKVNQLRAHGHDAFLHPQKHVILIRLKGRLYRVVGGDFIHPTLLEVKADYLLEMQDIKSIDEIESMTAQQLDEFLFGDKS